MHLFDQRSARRVAVPAQLRLIKSNSVGPNIVRGGYKGEILMFSTEFRAPGASPMDCIHVRIQNARSTHSDMLWAL